MSTTSLRPNPLGLALFLIYLTAYAVFIGIAAFKVSLLKTPVVAGVNLAVVYGMSLIVGAFVLALLYLRAPVHEDAP